MSKDAEAYDREYDAFIKQLEDFHQQRGTPLRKLPRINGKGVDLYLLYVVVTARGGWQKVNARNEWDEILEDFRLPPACVNSSIALKHIYIRYLDAYERINFLGEEGEDKGDGDDADDSRSHRSKRTVRSLNVVPLSYNQQQHNVHESIRNSGTLSNHLYKSSQYDKLALSLISPIPNEHDFAFNVCTILSNEGRHVLQLNQCPRLVENMLGHTGVYKDWETQKYFLTNYKNTRGRSLVQFWIDSVKDRSILDLLIPEIFDDRPHLQHSKSLDESSDHNEVNSVQRTNNNNNSVNNNNNSKSGANSDGDILKLNCENNKNLTSRTDCQNFLPHTSSVFDTLEDDSSQVSSSEVTSLIGKRSEEESLRNCEQSRDSIRSSLGVPHHQLSRKESIFNKLEQVLECEGSDLKLFKEDGEMFHLGRDHGVQDPEGSRISQILHIIRNLSFEEQNVATLASSQTCLRFLVLCMCSQWGGLAVNALDTLGNIAFEIKLNDPKIDSCSATLLNQICKGVFSADRAFVLRSLEVLNKLAVNDLNEEILNTCIDSHVYNQVCCYLTIHDIMLLIYTLECLYSLSSLGTPACNAIARARGSIHTLISLLTVEAQSYGPEACIGMKVVETVTGIVSESDPSATSSASSTATSSVTASAATTQGGAMNTSAATTTVTVNATPLTSTSVDSKLGSKTGVNATPEVKKIGGRIVPIEVEEFVMDWVKKNYEPNASNAIEQAIVYRHFAASMHSLGRRQGLNPVLLSNCVRKVFGTGVGPSRRPVEDGTDKWHYNGIKRRDGIIVPPLPEKKPFKIGTPSTGSVTVYTPAPIVSAPNTNLTPTVVSTEVRIAPGITPVANQIVTTVPMQQPDRVITPSSPILKAQLSAPLRPSPPPPVRQPPQVSMISGTKAQQGGIVVCSTSTPPPSPAPVPSPQIQTPPPPSPSPSLMPIIQQQQGGGGGNGAPASAPSPGRTTDNSAMIKSLLANKVIPPGGTLNQVASTKMDSLHHPPPTHLSATPRQSTPLPSIRTVFAPPSSHSSPIYRTQSSHQPTQQRLQIRQQSPQPVRQSLSPHQTHSLQQRSPVSQSLQHRQISPTQPQQTVPVGTVSHVQSLSQGPLGPQIPMVSPSGVSGTSIAWKVVDSGAMTSTSSSSTSTSPSPSLASALVAVASSSSVGVAESATSSHSLHPHPSQPTPDPPQHQGSHQIPAPQMPSHVQVSRNLQKQLVQHPTDGTLDGSNDSQAKKTYNGICNEIKKEDSSSSRLESVIGHGEKKVTSFEGILQNGIKIEDVVREEEISKDQKAVKKNVLADLLEKTVGGDILNGVVDRELRISDKGIEFVSHGQQMKVNGPFTTNGQIIGGETPPHTGVKRPATPDNSSVKRMAIEDPRATSDSDSRITLYVSQNGNESGEVISQGQQHQVILNSGQQPQAQQIVLSQGQSPAQQVVLNQGQSSAQQQVVLNQGQQHLPQQVVLSQGQQQPTTVICQGTQAQSNQVQQPTQQVVASQGQQQATHVINSTPQMIMSQAVITSSPQQQTQTVSGTPQSVVTPQGQVIFQRAATSTSSGVIVQPGSHQIVTQGAGGATQVIHQVIQGQPGQPQKVILHQGQLQQMLGGQVILSQGTGGQQQIVVQGSPHPNNIQGQVIVQGVPHCQGQQVFVQQGSTVSGAQGQQFVVGTNNNTQHGQAVVVPAGTHQNQQVMVSSSGQTVMVTGSQGQPIMMSGGQQLQGAGGQVVVPGNVGGTVLLAPQQSGGSTAKTLIILPNPKMVIAGSQHQNTTGGQQIVLPRQIGGQQVVQVVSTTGPATQVTAAIRTVRTPTSVENRVGTPATPSSTTPHHTHQSSSSSNNSSNSNNPVTFSVQTSGSNILPAAGAPVGPTAVPVSQTVSHAGPPHSKTPHVPAPQVLASGVARGRHHTKPSGLQYLCEWRGCSRVFSSAAQVYHHACKIHCPPYVQELQCGWAGCDTMTRRRFSAMTHLHDRHCNEQLLHILAVRRSQLASTGKTDIPIPQAPAPHPGYAPNAAFHAIKRHALEVINHRDAVEKEGPVTKSIRLTSALILRNLVIYSNTGKKLLRGFESELSNVAISTMESSRTVAQILYDIRLPDPQSM